MEAEDTELYVNEYDVGLLNDYGGGDIGWWHEYIRSIGVKAREHYQELSNIHAEVSFKTGKEEGKVRWLEAGKVLGRREVVEFLENNNIVLRDKQFLGWEAKLEEWDIK